MKQLSEKILVLRKRHHAIANVAWRKDTIVAAKAAGTSAVVGDGDDRSEIRNGPLNPAFGIADMLFESAEDCGESGAAAEGHNANWAGARVRTIFHGRKLRLGARTVSLGVEQFGESRVFLQECEVLVVAGVVAILGTQLNCDFQILHGGFRFAGKAIERGHGVHDVVSFWRGFARAVEVLASFVPAAKIHQRDSLRVMFFGGFHRGNRRTRDALFADAQVHLRAVAEFFAGTFKHALERLFGADELLLLKKLESFLYS